MNPFVAACAMLGASGGPDMPRPEHHSPEGAGTRRQRGVKLQAPGEIPAKTLRRRERKAQTAKTHALEKGA